MREIYYQIPGFSVYALICCYPVARGQGFVVAHVAATLFGTDYEQTEPYEEGYR